jgi:hypothetical protein
VTHVATNPTEGTIVDTGSVFELEPAAVHWLAETFDEQTPQHALLDSLALSAEAEPAPKGMRRVEPGTESRPLVDLLSEEKVGEIVHGVAEAFPELPVPDRPGRAQRRAIDRLIRRGR